ncbi:haloacid dehalogenase type II [Microvirga subterranea]|uniref:(S)-2-haloacid dehalogenase n=1 Tax=Microvirga subterranea TaxID=186651 RepID=A0A370HJR1_9HYPH|nr:haloacid dehalogenase type II [Microvirga subterranea]RDI58657.1 2-haloacid dehalogenase [Microvirga subterranea]
MPASSIIPPAAKAVIFDAYGTLFDVHSAVARHAASVGPDAARLSEIWRAKQLEYSWVLSLAGRYEPFWRLTEKALDHALARHPGVDRALRPLLLDAYRSLDAYAEVRPTLEALRARGLRTGILSNGDPAMLHAAVTSAGLGSLLDPVLSVDAAGVFKTSPRTYDLVLDALSVTAAEVVFVSSNRWDIAGAAAFGFAPVWVNRLGLPDEYAELPPRAVVSSLDGLL